MSRYTWPEGDLGVLFHELHCREDRCVFGCGCPCHGGRRMRLSWRGQVKRIRWKMRFRKGRRKR